MTTAISRSFLAVTRVIKVGELGLGSQGVEVVPGDLRIFLHCSVNIPERLYNMTLPAKFLIDKVEALGPFPGQWRLRGLQLLDCFIVTLALFVDARASAPQHREYVVRSREHKGVNQGAPNDNCDACHHFISAGMIPCLFSRSLVPMARSTSSTTMPTSRGVGSSSGVLPPIAILPSRAYPMPKPETTALW